MIYGIIFLLFRILITDNNISNIELVRLNESAMRVFAKEDVQFNSYSLKKGNYYLISWQLKKLSELSKIF